MRKMSFFEQNYTTLVPGAPSGLARAPMTRAQYQRGVLQQRQQRQQRQERQHPEFVDSAFPARTVDRYGSRPRVMYVWDGEYPCDARTEKICAALTARGHDVHLVARNRRWAPRSER